jgi:hypothetical protein
MNIPYNNGKVKIGSAYDLNPLKPKYIEQDGDMLEIQSYLIHDPAVLNKQYWANRIYLCTVLFVLTIMLLAN